MDIRWNGCAHTQTGTLPSGLVITLEQVDNDIYMDFGGEPVLDIFPSMEEAKEHAEMAALPYVRHMSCAEQMNARLEGYAL